MNFIKLFYLKWIRRCCPHFCFICEYKDWCMENGIDGLIKDLMIYLEK